MRILAAFVLICALPTPNLCVPAIQNGTDIFSNQFHMEYVGDSEGDTDRGDPQLMTNINHCLDGYNIFYGNPIPINEHMDPGYKRQIFKADYEPGRVTGDRRYLQPDGLEIRDCSQSCRIDFQSTEITGAKSYRESMKNKVSASVGGSFSGFGASFSASTDFTDAQEKTSKEEKIITQSSATCCSYEARISQFNPPLLTEDFQTAVERLPEGSTSGNLDEYFRFIDYFGTHYIDVAEYGSLYGMQAEITRKDWTTMTEKGRSVEIGASATAYGFTVSSGYRNENERKDAEEFKKHSTNQRIFSIGEIPPKSGEALDWVQKAKSSPAPMRLKLIPISKILENPFIKFRVPVSSAIKVNFGKALKDYCTKWLIKTAKFKYPEFSCSEPEDNGFPVTEKKNVNLSGDWHKIIHTGNIIGIAIKGNYLYGVGTDKKVYKHDLNGNGKWNKIIHTGNIIDIAIEGNYLYGVGTDKNVYKHALNGSGKWNKIIHTGSVIGIAIAGNHIYGVGTDNKVYEHALNGNGYWNKKIHTGSVSKIAINNNYIYGVGMDKKIYKYQ